MTMDDYKVLLYRNQPDGWVVEVPAIRGCYALMGTRQEALTELEGVFQMIAAAYQERGQPLPKDTSEILVGQSSGKEDRGCAQGVLARSSCHQG
jgi:predicted RNase H-like HicB family nuclease